jgi:foldase protein PrsA
MENSGKRAMRCALLLLMLIASFAMTGCGKRLVMTRGFGKEELFRIGNTNCTIQEYNVFLINLQKHCERTFGHAVWESAEGDDLKEAIEQRALSEASRLKVMLLLAVQDNIMLTDAEEIMADEAQTEYYESLSEEEKAYIGIEEEVLQDLFEQYALAQKVYNSIGTNFEERYDSFCMTLDYDLNESLWNTVALADIENLVDTPGFSEVYAKYFGTSSLGRDRTIEDESEGAQQ